MERNPDAQEGKKDEEATEVDSGGGSLPSSPTSSGESEENPDAEEEEVDEEDTKDSSGGGNLQSSSPSSGQMEENPDAKEEEGDEEATGDSSGSGNLPSSSPSSGEMEENPDAEEEEGDEEAKGDSSGCATGDPPSSSGAATSSSRGASQQSAAASNWDWDAADEGVFLFNVIVTPDDIVKDRLLVPAEDAADHFPSLQNHPAGCETTIKITSPSKDDYDMTLSYLPQEYAFLLTEGWPRLALRHFIQPGELITFHIPEPRENDKHFTISIVDPGGPYEFDFDEDKFMFSVELTPDDVVVGVLVLPMKEVRKCFPTMGLPAADHEVERVRWTDEQGRARPMKIEYSRDLTAYLISDGWPEFVADFGLEAGDKLRFYRPFVEHDQTFEVDNKRVALVKCVKKEHSE